MALPMPRMPLAPSAATVSRLGPGPRLRQLAAGMGNVVSPMTWMGTVAADSPLMVTPADSTGPQA